MIIEIEGRHVHVSDALQTYVKEKVEPLGRYFDGLHRVTVILTAEDTDLKTDRKVAEVVCSLVRGQQVIAKASGAGLERAIDEAVHKTRESLKKFKSRLRDRKRGLPEETPAAEGAENAEGAPGQASS